MIINYGKARLREKAEFVLTKMTDLGFKPSYITYESLITTYGYCDCVSRAQEIFLEMLDSGGELHVSTLNVVLDVYYMNGLPNEANLLLEYTSVKGLKPNASTYKLLYEAYMKANMKELVEKLLKDMERDGILPNKKFFLETLGEFGPSRKEHQNNLSQD